MRIESANTVFRVERATYAHDLEQAASTINAAYKKVKYLKDETQRVSPAELRAHIDDPKKRLYFCLSPEGKICGSLLMQMMEEDLAELGLFSIHPDFQGMKIAPQFLKRVENEAFKKAREIILKVIPLYQEPLIKFYERQGYGITGRIEPFSKEDQDKYIRPECRDKVYFSIMNKSR